MKQVAQHNKTGLIDVTDIPLPAMKEGHVLVQTKFSVISAGTERASISNRKASLVDKARKNPDLVAKVLEQVRQFGLLATYRRVRTRLDKWSQIGYSASGVVIAVGGRVADLKPGDLVACAGAEYANHAEFILIPKNLCVKVPGKVPADAAAFGTIGSIALQGVRNSMPTIGETMVVIGLGLVGQLTVQILKANGCRVIGIDPDPQVVELARTSGADMALRRSEDVHAIVRTYTRGVGADAVIITAATKSDDPVCLAGDLCRDRGRVVSVGDVGMNFVRKPYYMKELDFRVSRSYGPGRYDVEYEERGNDYPVGYVRWTENRNMQEFLRLLSTGKVRVDILVTHRFPIDEARKAYALLSQREGGKRAIGILLEYDSNAREALKATSVQIKPTAKLFNPLHIGFVGAGNFAQASLLPEVQRVGDAKLVGVCTANGLNANNVARQFGFQFATSRASAVIDHESIGTVFIATRHNLHAPLVSRALQAGKHVFVEKPLATTAEGLDSIMTAYKAAHRHTPGPILMTGFNRRFAPLVVKTAAFLENSAGPMVISYRVHAGLMPSSSWTLDPVEGGGRIIGEVCHFVDLMQFFTGSDPENVFAEPVGANLSGPLADDSVVVTVRFADGSVGVITYVANGDSSVPKEHIEIFTTGRTAVLDNFRSLTLHAKGSADVTRRSAIDKGHRDEIFQFLAAVRAGGSSPIPFESLVMTTRATLAMVESLRLGTPVRIQPLSSPRS